MENPELIEMIERSIDANGLQETLEMVSAICWEKASHILTNWQDQALAEKWEKAAKAVERACLNQAVISVS